MLELHSVAEHVAPSGVRFQVFIDPDGQRYTRLDSLWDSLQSVARKFFKGHFCPADTPSEQMRKEIGNVQLAILVYPSGAAVKDEVVSLVDVKNFLDNKLELIIKKTDAFPYEAFGNDKPRLFKNSSVIEDLPKCIFHSGGNANDFINICRGGEKNLVNISDVNYLLTGSVDPLSTYLLTGSVDPLSTDVQNAAAQFHLYYHGGTGRYYIDLRNVDTFLREIGDKAKWLRSHFAGEVFMEFPIGGCQGDIKAERCKVAKAPFGTVEIYRGVGFAENRYFAKSDNITDLLGIEDDNGIYSDALNAVGYVVAPNGIFCRLDDVEFIIKKYVARLWNGKNEQNKSIQRGWQLIDWLREYVPNFFRINVDYLALTHRPEHNCEEPAEVPIDTATTAIRDAFDAFNRAMENFRKAMVKENVSR